MTIQGTVADNIPFFDAPVDMARVIRSAEKANIASDIQDMPMQYYSLLAEAAMDIAGGQKQRPFIARAVYHEPKVLFLDEATSHLDTASERLVSESVRAMQVTRVLIAPRKETIAIADWVLVLDGATGLVVEVEHFAGVHPPPFFADGRLGDVNYSIRCVFARLSGILTALVLSQSRRRT